MEKRLFEDLIESVREAGRIARGEAHAKRVHDYSAERVNKIRKHFRPAQIVRVRHRLKMSQAEMAGVMLISKRTLQSWEQGRRRPDGPALVLIQVMSRDPEAVVKALHA